METIERTSKITTLRDVLWFSKTVLARDQRNFLSMLVWEENLDCRWGTRWDSEVQRSRAAKRNFPSTLVRCGLNILTVQYRQKKVQIGIPISL